MPTVVLQGRGPSTLVPDLTSPAVAKMRTAMAVGKAGQQIGETTGAGLNKIADTLIEERTNLDLAKADATYREELEKRTQAAMEGGTLEGEGLQAALLSADAEARASAGAVISTGLGQREWERKAEGLRGQAVVQALKTVYERGVERNNVLADEGNDRRIGDVAKNTSIENMTEKRDEIVLDYAQRVATGHLSPEDAGIKQKADLRRLGLAAVDADMAKDAAKALSRINDKRNPYGLEGDVLIAVREKAQDALERQENESKARIYAGVFGAISALNDSGAAVVLETDIQRQIDGGTLEPMQGYSLLTNLQSKADKLKKAETAKEFVISALAGTTTFDPSVDQQRDYVNDFVVNQEATSEFKQARPQEKIASRVELINRLKYIPGAYTAEFNAAAFTGSPDRLAMAARTYQAVKDSLPEDQLKRIPENTRDILGHVGAQLDAGMSPADARKESQGLYALDKQNYNKMLGARFRGTQNQPGPMSESGSYVADLFGVDAQDTITPGFTGVTADYLRVFQENFILNGGSEEAAKAKTDETIGKVWGRWGGEIRRGAPTASYKLSESASLGDASIYLSELLGSRIEPGEIDLVPIPATIAPGKTQYMIVDRETGAPYGSEETGRTIGWLPGIGAAMREANKPQRDIEQFWKNFGIQRAKGEILPSQETIERIMRQSGYTPQSAVEAPQ